MKQHPRSLWLAVIALVTLGIGPAWSGDPLLEIGLAERDVTPELPIWLAGYAARSKPAEQVDTPLLVQAMALRNAGGERFVVVSLDNCEVSHEFNEPALEAIKTQHDLERGRVMIVSSHTHSAPVLEGNLVPMYPMQEADRTAVRRYGERLRAALVEVVGAALADLQPARLEHGVGRAQFAMNRRVYRGNEVVFGENQDGPVDHDVPVLAVKTPEGALRGLVFGYACHPTSIAGEEFYTVSGDYIAYARRHLQEVYPGVPALFLAGMGADSNPSPRGRLHHAKRHGLELAGAVVGVLEHALRPVGGSFRFAYEEVGLPFVPAPSRDRLEADAGSDNLYLRNRARAYLATLDQGRPVPSEVRLPIAVVRLGNDLTFLAMGGEVVVDYARCFKRLFADSHPWTIGYAYEVPCYIPSTRIVMEGGYESDSSLIYYGFYGPFQGQVEQILVERMTALVQSTRE